MSSSFRRFDAPAPRRRQPRRPPPSTEESSSSAAGSSSAPPSDRDGGGTEGEGGGVPTTADAKTTTTDEPPPPSTAIGGSDDDDTAVTPSAPSASPYPSPPPSPPSTAPPPAASAPLSLKRGGTRPWTSGAALTSTGLRELDSALGGGQPLGSCLLVEEDRHTDLGVALARYWSAGAVSNGQTLLLAVTEKGDEDDASRSRLPRADPGKCFDVGGGGAARSCFGASLADARGFVAGLPRDQHLDKFRKREGGGGGRQRQQSQTPSEGGAAAAAAAAQSHDVSDLIPEGDEEDGEGGSSDDHDDDVGKPRDETEGDGDGDDDDDDDDEGLEIAWQYRLSIQRERRGGRPRQSPRGRTDAAVGEAQAEVYCHSYDLSGRMEAQFPPGVFWGGLLPGSGSSSASDPSPIDGSSSSSSPSVRIAAVDCSTCPAAAASSPPPNHRDRGVALFRTLLNRIRAELTGAGVHGDADGDAAGAGAGASVVVRLLVLNAPPRECSVAVPLLLAAVRSDDLPVALCVTVRPWLAGADAPGGGGGGSGGGRAALVRLGRSCDAVLAVDGFAGYREGARPPEFRDLAGLLTVKKVGWTSLGHFANRRPAAPRYGLRRDRRKLHVGMLHLPPEDFSAGGSSVSGGGARTGAGGGGAGAPPLEPGGACGGGGSRSATSNSLDF